TIGILGGGQLARMTALAAARLGYQTHIFAKQPDEPACQVTPWHTFGEFTDTKKLEVFADGVDIVTLEWENIPVETAAFLEQRVPCCQKPTVLSVTQNRLMEKSFAREFGLLTPEFRAAHSAAELKSVLEAVGAPSIVKTSRFGYDGKGQATLRDASQAETVWK